MVSMQHEVAIQAPLAFVYNQLLKFEDYATFMEGVQWVELINDHLLEWSTTYDGGEQTWQATLTSQQTNAELAWQATGKSGYSATFTLAEVDPQQTHLRLTVAYQDGNDGPTQRPMHDLVRFKRMAEARWQGSQATVGQVRSGPELARQVGGGASGIANDVGGGTGTGLNEDAGMVRFDETNGGGPGNDITADEER
ncbi:MAG: hypothetical protein MUD01_12630 [Chloroflexaceae bacterium]|nr:hypothetical protein [Chloroflexaceae bacterium]